jgi:tryptophan synthase beta subunit
LYSETIVQTTGGTIGYNERCFTLTPVSEESGESVWQQKAPIKQSPTKLTELPQEGHFGEFGGQFVPEILIPALKELERAYREISVRFDFQSELKALRADYGGRPTPLYFAKRLTEYAGGARIFLKREDLVHGGAHTLNNALGQALLARAMGKQRVIAETGSGAHGVAVAMAARCLGCMRRSTWGRATSSASR